MERLNLARTGAVDRATRDETNYMSQTRQNLGRWEGKKIILRDQRVLKLSYSEKGGYSINPEEGKYTHIYTVRASAKCLP